MCFRGLAFAVAVLMVSLSAVARTATAGEDAAPPAPRSPLFIVHFFPGPAWEAEKPFPGQVGASEHSANLKRLRDAGSILVGARYEDRGMIVLKAASEEEARAEIARDPMVAAGTFAMTIASFHPFFPGCIP